VKEFQVEEGIIGAEDKISFSFGISCTRLVAFASFLDIIACSLK
jgi:hypothetical protein